MTVFQWPQNAAVLETTLPNTSSGLSNDFEDKLTDLGIFREGGDDDGISQVEGAARRCGVELTRKQVRLSFDTFMAKSRPGLESDEEVKENSKVPIRTGGWSNPAWKIVQPQPSPALVRAF